MSVANMRRELQSRERRVAELEAALGTLRDKSSATDAQLATSRQRVRELEVRYNQEQACVRAKKDRIGDVALHGYCRNMSIDVYCLPRAGKNARANYARYELERVVTSAEL